MDIGSEEVTKVADVFRGKDGFVRTVAVWIGMTGTVLNRALTKLFPFECFRLDVKNSPQTKDGPSKTVQNC